MDVFEATPNRRTSKRGSKLDQVSGVGGNKALTPPGAGGARGGTSNNFKRGSKPSIATHASPGDYNSNVTEPLSSHELRMQELQDRWKAITAAGTVAPDGTSAE